MNKIHTHIQSSQKSSDVDTIIIPILQIKKLRHREIKWLSQDLKSDSIAPESMFLTSTLYHLLAINKYIE